MAAYKINATIYMDWHLLKSKDDATAEIQQMLDSYFYDNRSDCADICITHDSVKRITKAEMNKECYGL